MLKHTLLVTIILFWSSITSTLYDSDTMGALDRLTFYKQYVRVKFISYVVTYKTNHEGKPCYFTNEKECSIFPRIKCGSYSAELEGRIHPTSKPVVINLSADLFVDKECKRESVTLELRRTDNLLMNTKTIPSSGFYNNEYKYDSSSSNEHDWAFEYEAANWCFQDFGGGCSKPCLPKSYTHRCRDVDGADECVYGYGGSDCGSVTNLCTYNPCLNNAICKPKGSSFECVCFGGYIGTNCETLDCSERSCLNGACVNYGPVCQCSSQTSGKNCDKRSCPENYCQNKGVCKNSDSFYYCDCQPGTVGELCQHKCEPACVHGQCIFLDNYPVCQCEPTYTGIDCTKPITNIACKVDLCHNGGLCQVSSNVLGFFCACQENWIGVYCETPRCNTTNCIKGMCVNNNECKCTSGYTGARCDQKSCSGLSICKNGGTCIESSAYDISCLCTNDYTGIYCEQECKGGCGDNGKCVESSFGYTCECDNHHEGKNCEKLIETQVCKYSECQNGGICLEFKNSYTCSCSDYWSGPKCTIPSCTADKCQNGVCLDDVGCVCFEGYTGRRCESILCYEDYCKNNGYCVTDGYSLKCECDDRSLAGSQCQYTCPKRCVNGKCRETFAKTGKCLCDSGFTGEDCNARDTSTLLTNLFGVITGMTIVIFVISVIIYVVALKTFKPERDIQKERLDKDKIQADVAKLGDIYARSRA